MNAFRAALGIEPQTYALRVQSVATACVREFGSRASRQGQTLLINSHCLVGAQLALRTSCGLGSAT
jgi:hypothetical protein